MNNWRIRPGCGEDYPAMLEIWKAAVLATHDFLLPEDFAELERQMPTEYLPAMENLWICEDGDLPAGFMGANGRKVEMLFVRPEYFGQGIGRALIEKLRPCQGQVFVDVNEQNPGALAFYRKLGFSITGRSPVDEQGRAYPILHLARD